MAVFPSDHYIGNNERFMRQVEMAFQAVAAFPQLCVLLGITPEAPEPAYGWLEPTTRIALAGADLFRVRRFREKPDQATAARLYRDGWLWNSFILVAALPVLHSLFAEYTPELFCTFSAEMASTSPGDEGMVAEGLYQRLDSIGFSEEVLSRCPPNLAVLKTDDVEWNDLGEPGRVLDVVAAMNRRPPWFDAFAHDAGGNTPLS